LCNLAAWDYKIVSYLQEGEDGPKGEDGLRARTPRWPEGGRLSDIQSLDDSREKCEVFQFIVSSYRVW
jgi:hypothetical protein